MRDERAVIRNRILVHRDDTFCAVLKTNNGVTIGRNNNVTVEFSGTGRTTGFQCILDKQRPYFECMLFCGFTLRLASMFCLPFKVYKRVLKYSAVAKWPKLPGHIASWMSMAVNMHMGMWGHFWLCIYDYVSQCNHSVDENVERNTLLFDTAVTTEYSSYTIER